MGEEKKRRKERKERKKKKKKKKKLKIEKKNPHTDSFCVKIEG